MGQSDLDRGHLRPLIFRCRPTHAGNCLHHGRPPLVRRPTGKDSTEGIVVIVEKLMSIVVGGPCQLISRSRSRNGVEVPHGRGKHQVSFRVSWVVPDEFGS